LKTNPEEVRLVVSEQIENVLVNQELARILGAVQRRLGESVELTPAQMPKDDWDELAEQVIEASQAVMQRRQDRLLGSGPTDGQIPKDLEVQLSREKAPFTDKDKEQIRRALDSAISDLGVIESDRDIERVLQELKPVLARLDGTASEEHKERILEDLASPLREIESNGKVLTDNHKGRLNQYPGGIHFTDRSRIHGKPAASDVDGHADGDSDGV
jgi:hypothetical protein